MTDGGPSRIAVTMGDPNGIGPEILLKALAELGGDGPPVVVVGTRRVLEAAARRLGLDVTLVAGESPVAYPRIVVAEAADTESELVPGQLSAEAGRLAHAAVARAVDLALAGRVDAIVTAPISKDALNRAGYAYSGHTELLADLTGSPSVCMMLAHERLCVTHVSTHVALADVPSRVTPARVREVIGLTLDAMRDLGIAAPRVAVCGLNPHAGEGGLLGDADDAVIRPAIDEARAGGHDVSGPYPGDTIFVKAAAGQFDAVVAMFHDQGHIPVKLLGFRIDPETGRWTDMSGVNVTLGLPIVRTSVDHGTAFDIAGQGLANARSMIEAIDYATRLATRRATRKAG
ncbi:MAG: 4-hydroxythreonine-4-phosphate dehydrogenase PdxA [Azospirillaceae bacterium]